MILSEIVYCLRRSNTIKVFVPGHHQYPSKSISWFRLGDIGDAIKHEEEGSLSRGPWNKYDKVAGAKKLRKMEVF